MKDEYLLSLAAADIAGFIRNDLFDKYESNNIQGLDGFTLTYQDLSDDLNGLSDEIMEILKHPRKYKALLKAFAHIRNYQARSINEEENNNVRKWYIEQFPDDTLGQDIKPEVTFKDIMEALNDHKEIYNTFGIGDSIIRERIFEKMTEIYNIKYDDLYNKWLAS